MRKRRPTIAAIDLFCGAGGLSLGLSQAGINVVAGFDLDSNCRYPYEANIGATFYEKDVAELTGIEIRDLWPDGSLRLLAGCAPCQPFSSHRRGADTSSEGSWSLLLEFARLVRESEPDFVTMENVPRLVRSPVLREFIDTLHDLKYEVAYKTLFGPDFGLAQERRRLVLVASNIGAVRLPVGAFTGKSFRTVREAIGHLPEVEQGQTSPNDPMHRARRLSPINLARMRASKPGGTWHDWPDELVAECHRHASGASFQAFYGRMLWDAPAPTITTQAFNFGTGRFGHPEQDRSLTLREAAILQGFPQDYAFVPSHTQPTMAAVGRLVGNAVPPPFGAAVGGLFVDLATHKSKQQEATYDQGSRSLHAECKPICESAVSHGAKS